MMQCISQCSVYLHVGIWAFQEFLDSFEITLNIEVQIVGGAGLQEFVHGLHANGDESVSGIVPIEISVDPGGEILSDPVPLLRTGGCIVDQLLHIGRVQPVLLVGGVDVVHQPLVPGAEGGAAATRHDCSGGWSVI